MAELPSQLLARLDADDAAACLRTIDAVGEELAAVYAANVNDHREARGDNAVLFGMKVWVHGDFRITGRLEDDKRAKGRAQQRLLQRARRAAGDRGLQARGHR
ncbi:MAG: hypothetical protein M3Y17_07050 [Actinomycetota bacterium]|nr:hypothetical protein [Actinomycetota bacterium]